MRILQAAAAVFVFWLVLAMPLAAADLLWGALVAVLVGLVAALGLWRGTGPGLGLRRLGGLTLHVLDLIRSVVPAALQMTRLVFDPAMPVRPLVITYRTGLKSPLARAALANTITLTPGTHCVDLEGDELTIHCLDESFARAILDGRVEARIARALGAEETAG